MLLEEYFPNTPSCFFSHYGTDQILTCIVVICLHVFKGRIGLYFFFPMHSAYIHYVPNKHLFYEDYCCILIMVV